MFVEAVVGPGFPKTGSHKSADGSCGARRLNAKNRSLSLFSPKK